MSEDIKGWRIGAGKSREISNKEKEKQEEKKSELVRSSSSINCTLVQTQGTSAVLWGSAVSLHVLLVYAHMHTDDTIYTDTDRGTPIPTVGTVRSVACTTVQARHWG